MEVGEGGLYIRDWNNDQEAGSSDLHPIFGVGF
jgi:hypothetical protein